MRGDSPRERVVGVKAEMVVMPIVAARIADENFMILILCY